MENDNIHIGERTGWGGGITPFGISCRDRRQHLYALGKSGVGKTTLLRNVIVADIEAGRGVGVIDPHGDLADEILNLVPSKRIEEVVYFNPADADWPISFNLLSSVAPCHRHLVASGIVSAFKSTWPEFWGPRLEYILYASVAALLECQKVSLLGIPRLLTDAGYRSWVVRQVKDPALRSFWINEFGNYEKRFLNEAIAPIQNKVGRLLMSPHIRNIVGQVKRKIDARFMMDNSRIFIADLSKGRLGADASNLLGALLVTQFQLAAMSRSDVPEEARRDFYLCVDEFQSFATDSFVGILSEARKYRLCLTLSHQYIDQLSPHVRDAVFGNVGSIVAFRVGERDAEILEREFGGAYSRSQFAGLGNHEICAKILTGGEYGDPFAGKTLPPRGTRYGLRGTIQRRSREKYATERAIVEDRIIRWHGTSQHSPHGGNIKAGSSWGLS